MMTPKIKDAYIRTEFNVNFFFSFLLFSFLFSVEGVFRAIEYMVSGTFYPLAVLSIFLITFISAFQYIIPLTFLYGVTALFSRLSADRELIITTSAGLRLAAVLKPLFKISVFTSVFLLFCNLYLIPEANLKRRTMLHDLRFKQPLAILQEKSVISDIPGLTIYAGSVTDDYRLSNIAITQGLQEHVVFLKAEKGRVTHNPEKNILVFDLQNGLIITHLADEEISTLNFGEYRFSVDLPQRFSPQGLRKRISEAPTAKLLASGTIENGVEINRRVVFAFTPMVFLFMGAGIGAKLRQKSRILHIGLGGLVSILFLQLSALGELLSRRFESPAFIWLSLVILALISVILLKNK